MYNLPKILRVRWLEFLNDSGFEVPAYGVVRIVDADAGQWTAERPDGSDGIFAVNGPDAVADGASGACTRDWPAYALYDDGDGEPANGETWGPGADTFKLRLGNDGFLIVGAADTDSDIVLVEKQDSGGGGAPELWYYRHVGSSPLEVWHAGAAGGSTPTLGESFTADTLYTAFFNVPKSVTLDRIALTCTVAGSAGHKARLGIYRSTSDTNVYPGALLLDAGEVDLDTSGNKTLTINQTLEAGAPYHFAMLVNSASPLIRRHSGFVDNLGTMQVGATNAWSLLTGFTNPQSYGALPDPFPSGAPAPAFFNQVPFSPHIRVRLSA
jgi:hypothetical protein